MANKVTSEDIMRINEIYYKTHTYAETGRQTGFSAGTVKKYVVPGWKPVAAENVKRFSLSELPELFICANDFVAMDVLASLKTMNIECPRDIKLIGFDDSMESKIITPALSTCHIHSQVMGYSAANLIISRIQQPELNYRIVYTETDLIYRESSN